MTDLAHQVWERVAHLTGRDMDELDDSLTLQDDLGFDSLKIMSLWQAVFGLLPPGISGDLNDFASVQTLGDLVAALDEMSKQEIIADTRAAYVSETDPGGQTIPMAHAQQFFLLSHQLVQSTSLCSSIEVNGTVDKPRLQRAWQSLMDRHINLRTCFYVPSDATQLMQTQYRLLPDRAAPVPRDIQVGTEGAETWDDLFHAQLNREWDLRAWPLHEVMVAKIEEGKEAIVLANEHIISDGLGNQRLLADLVALYDDPDAVLPPVLDGDAYVSAVTEMNAYQSDEDEADFKEREATMAGIQSIWDPINKVGQDNGKVMFRNKRFSFDQTTTDQLQTLAGKAGTSLYSFLLASLTMRFRDRLDLSGSTEPTVLQVPTGGKVFPGIELHETVGCFAQNLSICSRDLAGDIATDAKAIGRDLRDALISGHDRTQSRLMALAMAGDFPMENGLVPRFALDQARKSLRGNLYAPYVGESTLPSEMAGMALEGYRSATKNASGTVDVLHEIHDGKLIVFLNYDEACFDDADIDAFLQDHVETLTGLLPKETPAEEGLIATLKAQVAQLVHRDVSMIDETADLHTEIGLDSLGKIRLVNGAVPAKGGRKLARRLVDCTTLAEMAEMIGGEDVIKAPASIAPTAQPMREGLPEVPLRHIEAQAVATPDAEAVTDGNISLTYNALNTQANQLAHTLSGAGVTKGDTVAVTCARGPDMLVALLGIMKLGAAYVPLDPAFPADRMRYIVEHARSKVWVGDLPQIGSIFKSTEMPASITGFVGLGGTSNVLPIQDQIPRDAWSNVTTTPVADIAPDDLMVLLYTSGSTGHPKGVACHHRGYMNRIDWHQEQFQLCPGERVALKTSFSFDVSVWELFWPLMVGGTVCTANREIVSNPWHLADWLAEHRIGVMHFVPSLFNAFVTSNCDQKLDLPHLRWLIFSGEALGVSPVRTWMTTQSPHTQLANLYGPTEASIDVTCEVIDTIPASDDTRISIGRAIKNTQMLILDENNQPITEAGKQGELCIAGVQLASGYHRDIIKTASAFTYNHLQEQGVPGLNIYRTGDLAMWFDDGRIDYMGRLDSQIKLRGFRIELGEIEAVVAAHPDVHEAAARVKRSDDGSQDQLAVFYAPADVNADVIRDLAAQKLAAYAVPDLFVGQAVLPKNNNGKLDRKALSFDASPVDDSVVTLTPVLSKDTVVLVSPAQAALLAEQAPSHCGASLLMLDYEAELDIERFTQAIRNVIVSHPALRSVFEKQRSQWMRRTLADVPDFEPELFDATMLGEEEFRRDFKLVADERARTLRPDQWPLISVQVAKRGPQKCSIAILGSTLIGDMVGAFAFGRAIWQHYLDTQGKTPMTPVEDSQDLVGMYQNKVSDPESNAAWWQTHLGAIPDGTTLAADWACGDNTHGSSREIEHVFSPTETVEITDAVTQSTTGGLYDVIAAALYTRLGTEGKTDSVTVAHRVNGRNVVPERIYFNSIDCFAYNFPIRLDLRPGESLAQTADRLNQLQKDVPFKGYSYDAAGDDLPASHWPASKASDVRLNFLGEARTPQNSSVRFVPDASSGRIAPDHAPRNYALECVVQLRAGSLVISAHYSENLYKPETVETFLSGLVSDLRGFVTITSKKELTHAA